MNLPTDIQDILLTIIETGVIRIRAFLLNDKVAAYITEADHIHNLPTLVKDFKLELLAYYLNTEVPIYVEKSDCKIPESMYLHWQKLADFVKQARL